MKKSFLFFLTGLLILGLFVGTVSAMGGSGTASNPWTINTLNDLKLLSETGYASYIGNDKYFILTSDIVDDNGSFTPIGNSSYPFNGRLNGNGHTISCLKQPLILYLGNNANIENVNFSSCVIDKNNASCLAEQLSGSNVQIKNCNFDNCFCRLSASINSAIRTGIVISLCNSNSGCNIENVNINHCTAQAEHTQNYFSGSANSYGGLIFGYSNASNITITNCSVENSVINSKVKWSQQYDYARFVGHNGSGNNANLIVQNSTFKNITYRNCDSGGIISNAFTDINNSISGIQTTSSAIICENPTGLTSDAPQSEPKFTWEIVTFNLENLRGTTAHIDGSKVVSGLNFTYGSGGTPTSNPLKVIYSNAGTKNVSVEVSIWSGSVIGTFTTTAYIKVPYTPTLRGSGTSSDPYQVGSNANLQEWGEHTDYYNNMYMIITADFVPATTVSTFAGNLAGGNHTLTNIRLPLFNTLGGTVNNLKFTNSIVSGNGILANTSSAAVSNVTADDCFVSGSTTGGLVGNATGSFTDCTVNHITVKGSSTAGGIAGTGNTTVTRCKVLNTDLLAPTTYGVCA